MYILINKWQQVKKLVKKLACLNRKINTKYFSKPHAAPCLSTTYLLLLNLKLNNTLRHTCTYIHIIKKGKILINRMKIYSLSLVS